MHQTLRPGKLFSIFFFLTLSQVQRAPLILVFNLNSVTGDFCFFSFLRPLLFLSVCRQLLVQGVVPRPSTTKSPVHCLDRIVWPLFSLAVFMGKSALPLRYALLS